MICANMYFIFIICIKIIAFFCLFRKIALSLQKNYRNLSMEEKTMWQKVRKVLINKYAIAIYVFLLMLLFMGDNSLVHYMKRARKIRMVKEQIVDTQQEIREAQSVIQLLDNTDSLEHFAREEYRMHAPNEDVYIVEP